MGETSMQQVLDPSVAASVYGIGMITILWFAKLLASVSCLGLRYPGGVFGPAIFIGAALGGMLGFAAPFLDYQICVLVGMGALVSSVIGAPLATILIVFELTENYQATTAVMMGVVAANAVVTRYYARSIFHRQVLRWGIDLERPKEQRLMSERRVEEVMSPRFLAVEPERSAAEMRALVGRSGAGDVFVVAGDDLRLEGKVPLTTLVAAGDARSAGELCEPVDHMLLASDDLWSGLLGIEHFVGYSVPVVADRESRRLVGVVTESDFISAYRKSVREIREDLEDS